MKAEHGKAVAAKLAEWDKLWAAAGRGPANAVTAPPARPDGKSDAAKAGLSG